MNSIAERSVNTRLISQRFEKLKFDEVVTYAELEQLCLTSRDKLRGNINSAKRFVRTEFQIVLDVVRGTGYKRLPPVFIVESAERDVKHIARTARTGIKKLGCVDLSALDNGSLIDFNIRASQLGVLSNVAGPRGAKRLENVVTQKSAVLNLSETISAFQK
jgi:hypothetical protein